MQWLNKITLSAYQHRCAACMFVTKVGDCKDCKEAVFVRRWAL